jgi:hypothetical protein
MERVDGLASRLSGIRDECEAAQIGGAGVGEGWSELLRRFESGKGEIERAASLVDSGAFEAVATKVAGCGGGSLVGVGGLGLVGLAGLVGVGGLMGFVEEDVDTLRKFEFLVSIGASAGKYTRETEYFASAFASKRVLASVEEELLMDFVGHFCKAARESSAAASREVRVDRGALNVQVFMGGEGGLAGVSQARMRLGGVEGLAYGPGAVIEAMGALWAQLSDARASVFLEGGKTAAYGLVPRPDAEAEKLELLGWVMASGVRGNYTLGGVGVSPPVLGWMLGTAAEARDLVGLSEAGSCDASRWTDGVEMETVDWVDAIGAVGTLLDGAALSLMVGSVVTAENFGALAEHAAAMIRERLRPALESLRKGFDVGLCGAHSVAGAEGRVMIGAVMEAGASRASLRINGPRSVDTGEWRAQTRYVGGYTASSVPIEMFWRVVEGLEMGDKLRVLKFWTGRSAPAASGAHEGGFTIRLLGAGPGGDRLVPESSTCFSELRLSEYGEDETEELRKHIGVAMEYADVMGGV